MMKEKTLKEYWRDNGGSFVAGFGVGGFICLSLALIIVSGGSPAKLYNKIDRNRVRIDKNYDDLRKVENLEMYKNLDKRVRRMEHRR